MTALTRPLASRRTQVLGSVAALAILLSGCAATAGTSQSTPHGTSAAGQKPAGAKMSPGMKMSPGGSSHDNMAAMTTGTGPSASARMICGPEIRRAVVGLLAAPTPLSTSTSWVNHVYTCAYHLRQGPLVLSVQDASNPAAGRSYFDALKARLGNPPPLRGLVGFGLPSFQTNDGTVVFLKDGKTLRVDATRLPQPAGPQHQSRGDVAYGVAADVVACWSE